MVTQAFVEGVLKGGITETGFTGSEWWPCWAVQEPQLLEDVLHAVPLCSSHWIRKDRQKTDQGRTRRKLWLSRRENKKTLLKLAGGVVERSLNKFCVRIYRWAHEASGNEPFAKQLAASWSFTWRSLVYNRDTDRTGAGGRQSSKSRKSHSQTRWTGSDGDK